MYNTNPNYNAENAENEKKRESVENIENNDKYSLYPPFAIVSKYDFILRHAILSRIIEYVIQPRNWLRLATLEDFRLGQIAMGGVLRYSTGLNKINISAGMNMENTNVASANAIKNISFSEIQPGSILEKNLLMQLLPRLYGLLNTALWYYEMPGVDSLYEIITKMKDTYGFTADEIKMLDLQFKEVRDLTHYSVLGHNSFEDVLKRASKLDCSALEEASVYSLEQSIPENEKFDKEIIEALEGLTKKNILAKHLNFFNIHFDTMETNSFRMLANIAFHSENWLKKQQHLPQYSQLCDIFYKFVNSKCVFVPSFDFDKDYSDFINTLPNLLNKILNNDYDLSPNEHKLLSEMGIINPLANNLAEPSVIMRLLCCADITTEECGTDAKLNAVRQLLETCINKYNLNANKSLNNSEEATASSNFTQNTADMRKIKSLKYFRRRGFCLPHGSFDITKVLPELVNAFNNKEKHRDFGRVLETKAADALSSIQKAFRFPAQYCKCADNDLIYTLMPYLYGAAQEYFIKNNITPQSQIYKSTMEHLNHLYAEGKMQAERGLVVATHCLVAKECLQKMYPTTPINAIASPPPIVIVTDKQLNITPQQMDNDVIGQLMKLNWFSVKKFFGERGVWEEDYHQDQLITTLTPYITAWIDKNFSHDILTKISYQDKWRQVMGTYELSEVEIEEAQSQKFIVKRTNHQVATNQASQSAHY